MLTKTGGDFQAGVSPAEALGRVTAKMFYIFAKELGYWGAE